MRIFRQSRIRRQFLATVLISTITSCVTPARPRPPIELPQRPTRSIPQVTALHFQFASALHQYQLQTKSETQVTIGDKLSTAFEIDTTILTLQVSMIDTVLGTRTFNLQFDSASQLSPDSIRPISQKPDSGKKKSLQWLARRGGQISSTDLGATDCSTSEKLEVFQNAFPSVPWDYRPDIYWSDTTALAICLSKYNSLQTRVISQYQSLTDSTYQGRRILRIIKSAQLIIQDNNALTEESSITGTSHALLSVDPLTGTPLASSSEIQLQITTHPSRKTVIIQRRTVMQLTRIDLH